MLFRVLLLFLCFPVSFCFGGGDGFTSKDREFLIRLDERLNSIDKRFEQIDKRFEQVDKRFAELREDMNKRFEQIDKRFVEMQEDTNKRFAELREDMNKRFEQVDNRFGQVDQRFQEVGDRISEVVSLLVGIVGAFSAIVVLSIGFAIWDRRTMIRPFEKSMDDVKAKISGDAKKLSLLLDALREHSRHDPGLAEILRSFALL